MSRIFVIGSINTDLCIRAPYFPKQGETLTGSGFFTARGGKGANQAVAAARLGGEVVMGGCVGDDTFGREALDALKKDGVDVSMIRVVPGTPTGTAVIVLTDGDNRILLDPGANAKLTEADVDRTLAGAKPGDILLAPLENPIPVIGYALKRGRELGMFVMLNPAPANRDILPYVSFCDLILPNETETELLGGKAALRALGTDVLITLGSKGYSINGTVFPCPKITPVDTTAAGDTFCGGLCAALSYGETLENAARFGSRAASLACTRAGAQPSIPTKAEVENWK